MKQLDPPSCPLIRELAPTRIRHFLEMIGAHVPEDLEKIRVDQLTRYRGVGVKTALEIIEWAQKHHFRIGSRIPTKRDREYYAPRRCSLCGAVRRRRPE